MPVSSCLARSMPAWDSVQRFLFVPQLPLAQMFVACPGPNWPAAPPCGLPVRGRECRAGRLRVQRHAVLASCGARPDPTVAIAVWPSQWIIYQRRSVLKTAVAKDSCHFANTCHGRHQLCLDSRRLTKPTAPVCSGATREGQKCVIIRDFIESPGPFARSKRSPAFLVVSGPQGVGKDHHAEQPSLLNYARLKAGMYCCP